MSTDTQRLESIIASTAQLINELARETGVHQLTHDCITGEIGAHVRSYADLQQLPGEAIISKTGSGGLYCYRAEKRVGEITFFVYATKAEVVGLVRH